MIRRYIEESVREDLKRKMVFVAGPRQVGKTFLAKYMLPDEQGYLNWDIPLHRDRILKREYPPVSMLVFDEIHKYRDWRNYLKGFYDQFENKIETLVTGSARLEYYRFGGDSLQGRYHMHRLFPFTYGELDSKRQESLFDLFTLGGFPEPFLSGSETTARRWTREYRDLLVHEEIISLENVQDTGSMQLCAIRLAELTSSPLSINALREDLQVSHKTVSRWLEIFSRLYMIFRISPFGSTKIRAVKKEQKHYFFDWNVIEEKGSRFENMVAVHLYKWVCHKQDAEGMDYDLSYFRDTDGREVDFIVTLKSKPVIAVEVKSSDQRISKSLKYFIRKFPEVQAFQISLDGKKDYISENGIRVMPGEVFLRDY